jgi:hypothetical protein
MAVTIYGSGQVPIQVVQATFTGTQTIANNSGFVQITSLSLNITPKSASNKILLQWTVNAGSNNNQPGFTLYRNGSATAFIGDAGSGQTRVSTGLPLVGSAYMITVAGMYLDSPASTSAQTYAIYANTTSAGDIYIGRSATDSANAAYLRAPCSLVAMEISGA